ncbi:hypothetical protein [Sphingobacterium multivorum]|uniref:hypothetical protein n=1 Tax=Sphingobacterium multivorum TaxID=28454 RepID=UPI0031BA4D91
MFPSLPTDNLYKFSFVGCLFLIIFIVYTNTKKEELLTDSRDKFIIEQLKRNNVVSLLSYDVSLVRKEALDLIADSLIENNEGIRKGDSLLNVLKEQSKKVEELSGDGKILTENINSVEKKLESFRKDSKYWNILIIGLFNIMVFSGIAWYHKVQKYQDSILKNDAILKEKEVSNTLKNESSTG